MEPRVDAAERRTVFDAARPPEAAVLRADDAVLRAEVAVRLAEEAVRFAVAAVLRAPRVVAALLAAADRFDGVERLEDRLEERLDDEAVLRAVDLRDDERRRFVPVLRSFAGISERATAFARRVIWPWRNFAICSSWRR